MKKKVCLFILLTGLLNNSFIPVNGAERKEDDIPKVVKKKLKELYPGAYKVKWDKKKKKYKAEFEINDKEIELFFNSKGKVLRTERELAQKDLPDAILKKITARNVPLRNIEIKSTEKSNAVVYAIDGVTISSREKLKFNGKGNLISHKIKHLKSKKIAFYDTKWVLPPILREISGISLINDSLVACVQDELGVIYIYDLNSSKISNEIPFGAPGDYEGIALVGKDAWVLRSDGKIFHVADFLENNPAVHTYFLQLEKEQDMEGLCYDKPNHRLVIVPRGYDTSNPSYKGVYSFNLKAKKFLTHPVFRIHLSHPLFSKKEKKKDQETIKPSSIDIHPVTKKMFVSDALNFQLLVLSKTGNLEDKIRLDKDLFLQAEGIAFNTKGELYIANEGGDKEPVILKLDVF